MDRHRSGRNAGSGFQIRTYSSKQTWLRWHNQGSCPPFYRGLLRNIQMAWPMAVPVMLRRCPATPTALGCRFRIRNCRTTGSGSTALLTDIGAAALQALLVVPVRPDPSIPAAACGAAPHGQPLRDASGAYHRLVPTGPQRRGRAERPRRRRAPDYWDRTPSAVRRPIRSGPGRAIGTGCRCQPRGRPRHHSSKPEAYPIPAPAGTSLRTRRAWPRSPASSASI